MNKGKLGFLIFVGLFFYGNALARFLQVDPKREFFNPYSYVGNNPIMGTDSTGMNVDLRQLVEDVSNAPSFNLSPSDFVSFADEMSLNIHNSPESSVFVMVDGMALSPIESNAYSQGLPMEYISLARMRMTEVVPRGSMNQTAIVYDGLGNELDRYDPNLRRGINLGAMVLTSQVGSMFSARLSPKTVNISSWAESGVTPDLNSGRWVMLGKPTKANFWKSGLPGGRFAFTKNFPFIKRFPGKIPFTNSTTGTIAPSQLQWPKAILERWKGILGQRQIK